MPRRVLKDKGKNWDLFCLLRNTTSIFKLIYSQDVHGSFDILKEPCTEDTTEGDDIATYLNLVYIGDEQRHSTRKPRKGTAYKKT